MSSGTNKWLLGLLSFTLFSGGLPADSHAQEKEALLLASRILDQEVYDETQKLIGEADDLIIRRSGKVKKLTVEFGGFIDIGDKRVALPFKRFRMKDGKIALEVTEQQLEKKSEFDYYTHGLQPDYYYRGRPYTTRYPRPSYYYGPGAAHPPIEPYEMAFSPSRFLASALMNRRIINEEGKRVGRVKDLVINRKNNEVEKIILSSIDILGEEVHVALSYEPLGFTAYGLVYDITLGTLKDYIYPYEE